MVNGAHLAYTSHYLIENFDVVGIQPKRFRQAHLGIEFGNNASDMTLVNSKVDGFATCISISDVFVGSLAGRFDLKQHTGIGSQLANCGENYNAYNPQIFNIVDSAQLVPERFSIVHNAPLVFNNTDRRIRIRPVKTDSLGSIDLPAGMDDYDFGYQQVREFAEEQGYFTAGGKNYFLIEDYYSDRVTGELHKFGEWVEINDDIRLGNQYFHFSTAKNNGEISLNSTSPVAKDDTMTTSMETEVTLNLLANDSDPDGDALRIDGIVQPAYGQVFDNGDGTITYRPNLEFSGVETFKYWVTDGNTHFSPANVSVTVSP